MLRVPPGTRDSLPTTNGTRPNCIIICSVEGWFHTHPNWNSEGYDGYKASPGDIAFGQSEARAPSVIMMLVFWVLYKGDNTRIPDGGGKSFEVLLNSDSNHVEKELHFQ